MNAKNEKNKKDISINPHSQNDFNLNDIKDNFNSFFMKNII